VRRVYPPVVAESLFRLCEEREVFLAAVDRLPRTFCHHDAFRRNLFAERSADGGYHTVASDWALAGTGVIGEELLRPVIMPAGFFEVEVGKLQELDATILDGYLRGLRDAGCQGDGRMAHLGSRQRLLWGSLLLRTFFISVLTDESQHTRWEQVFGHPVEQVVDHWAELLAFVQGLEEQARRLMEELEGGELSAFSP
jgi:hypothetical protein